MMENKISYEDERKMTNAIESAATLASNDASRNRSETLAGQLKEAGVDPRFAKVASAAFNKRLTVLTFKKTADEHKADPFELADGDKVLELMTGEPLEKAASVEAPFEITYTQNMEDMQKAASAETPARQLYEDTVRYEALVAHVESIMEKNAAALQDIVDAQDNAERKADALSTELADYFMKNASASFEFDTLVNAFGDRFKNAIGSKLPETTEYIKTASGAILPDEPLYKKATELINAHETSETLKEALGYYSEGLSQFCKAASDLGDLIQKLELGLTKEAASGVDLTKQYIAELGMLPGAALTVGTGAADNLINGVSNTAGNAFQNAYALYQAGNAAHMAPHEILDAEFLTKDRYRDRLLGWSDMTADPQFSMYPAEQVFMATQKAMDMDTTLERPDKREVLRAYVAQLLAQNNRLSTADIAAFAQTLRGLTSGDEHGAQQLASAEVKKMEETKAPELPTLRPLIEGRRDVKWDDRAEKILNAADKTEKDFEGSNKPEKSEKPKSDESKGGEKKPQKQKPQTDPQEAQRQFLTRVMGIQIGTGKNGQLTYTQNGKHLSQRDIDAIIQTAQKVNALTA